MSLLEQQELEQDAAAPAGLLPPAATPAHAGRAVRHRCVVDPDRQILGNAEVPGGMEGVLLWDKINTLVADYGEKREGEERGESAREGEEEGESVREREEDGSASEIP
jgi:hypothetical protein